MSPAANPCHTSCPPPLPHVLSLLVLLLLCLPHRGSCRGVQGEGVRVTPFCQFCEKQKEMQRASSLPSKFTTHGSYTTAFVNALQEYLQLQLNELAVKYWAAHRLRGEQKANKGDFAAEERYYESHGVRLYLGSRLWFASSFFLFSLARPYFGFSLVSEQDNRGFPRQKINNGRFFMSLRRRQKSSEYVMLPCLLPLVSCLVVADVVVFL